MTEYAEFEIDPRALMSGRQNAAMDAVARQLRQQEARKRIERQRAVAGFMFRVTFLASRPRPLVMTITR